MNFIFGVAFLLGFAALVLFGAIAIFKKVSGKDTRGALKNTLISFIVAVIGFIGVGITQEDAPETNNDSNQSESASEPATEKSELSEGQQEVVDNVIDFPVFLDSYKNLEASERTPVWDKEVYGTNVNWTGTIFEVGGQQIYVIDSSKYQKGMDWLTVSTTPDAYSVFVADFETDINNDDFPIGTEVTVIGDLESRGDPDLNYHWKIYNAKLN